MLSSRACRVRRGVSIDPFAASRESETDCCPEKGDSASRRMRAQRFAARVASRTGPGRRVPMLVQFRTARMGLDVRRGPTDTNAPSTISGGRHRYPRGLPTSTIARSMTTDGRDIARRRPAAIAAPASSGVYPGTAQPVGCTPDGDPVAFADEIRVLIGNRGGLKLTTVGGLGYRRRSPG